MSFTAEELKTMSQEDQEVEEDLAKSLKSRNARYQRGFRARNKIKVLKQQKRHYEANKTEIALYQKKYYQENKNKVTKYMKNRYEVNKPEILKKRKTDYEAKKAVFPKAGGNLKSHGKKGG